MSRFISLSRAAVRRLSAASTPAFLLHQSKRHHLLPQSQPSLPPPQRHFFSPCDKHFCTAAAERISSTNPSAVPVFVASFVCCQFWVLSYLFKSFGSHAEHLEDIVIILLHIKHLIEKRLSQQRLQVLFLMCGTVVSLMFPVVQAILIAVEEILPDSTIICRLIIAGGVMAGLLVKFFWARLISNRAIHSWLP